MKHNKLIGNLVKNQFNQHLQKQEIYLKKEN